MVKVKVRVRVTFRVTVMVRVRVRVTVMVTVIVMVMVTMKDKEWKYYPDDCNGCGSSIEIFTDKTSKEGWVWDQDPIRCTTCKAEGQMSVSEDCAYTSWDEDTFSEIAEPLEVYINNIETLAKERHEEMVRLQNCNLEHGKTIKRLESDALVHENEEFRQQLKTLAKAYKLQDKLLQTRRTHYHFADCPISASYDSCECGVHATRIYFISENHKDAMKIIEKLK